MKNTAQLLDQLPNSVVATFVNNEPLQSMEPDWSEIWSSKKAEAELPGFIFRGLGWYLNKDDSMLVLPYGTVSKTTPTKRTGVYPEGTKLYMFCVYASRNPAETFNWIINAPTRQDERK